MCCCCYFCSVNTCYVAGVPNKKNTILFISGTGHFLISPCLQKDVHETIMSLLLHKYLTMNNKITRGEIIKYERLHKDTTNLKQTANGRLSAEIIIIFNGCHCSSNWKRVCMVFETEKHARGLT